MSLTEKPGLVVSSAAHAAMLVAMVVSFAGTPKFQDAQETIPVEMLTTSDLNQIMRGDKTAKEVQPKQRADKVADTNETKPQPPLAEAKKDVPTPPSPDKKLDDPGQADKPVPKPVDAKAPPPKPEVKPDQPKPKPDEPKPDPDAEPLKKAEAPKKPEPKKPELKLDQIAKLLEKDKKLAEAPAKPKSGDENPDKHKFDLNDINKVLLSKENAQRKAATGKELSQVASLGSPTASATRMSPSLEAQMEGWFQDRFQGCWTQPITIPPGQKYVPMIRVPLNIDGSLAAEPTLVNPPNDPAWQPLAESALRAVRKCDPLPVPARFKPYYDEWRGRIVRFNDDAL